MAYLAPRTISPSSRPHITHTHTHTHTHTNTRTQPYAYTHACISKSCKGSRMRGKVEYEEARKGKGPGEQGQNVWSERADREKEEIKW